MRKIKVLELCAMLGLGISLASCTKNTNSDDYTNITSSVKLDASYEGKSFFKDGIGKVTVAQYTDGDTTTFKEEKGSSFKIRYYAINTPESTGAVEKWGKAASKFTHDHLANASDIVVEATASKPEVDSYSERYLGYVWYRSSSSEDFKCLNIQLVENGFSDSNALAGSKYYEAFKKAESFAKEKKLHIQGNDKDKYFAEDPYDVSIKELNADAAKADAEKKYYHADEEYGERVEFDAYILNHSMSGDSNYYIVAQFDEDGTANTIKLYGGYSTDIINTSIYTGSYVHFTGSINYDATRQSYYLAIGHTYSATLSKDGYTYIKMSYSYCRFDSNFTSVPATAATTNQLYKVSSEKACYSDLTVTSTKVENKVLTIVGTAFKHNKDGEEVTDTYTFNVKLSEYNNTNINAGDVIQINGIQTGVGTKVFNTFESSIKQYLTK